MAVLRLLVAVVLACAVALPAAAEPRGKGKPAPAKRQVGLELVLAVDGSASISGGALEFQLRGHAAAFRDPAVVEAVAARGVAVTLASFSGPRSLKVLVPWTVVSNAKEAEAFAAAIAAAPRDGLADSTAIGAAIEQAAALFGASGTSAPRKVIDLVSNGFSNSGLDPAVARDRAVARGITVNGLAILDEFPWLEEYFQESVIGGEGAFVRTAESRESFAEALRQKLIIEIAGTAARAEHAALP